MQQLFSYLSLYPFAIEPAEALLFRALNLNDTSGLDHDDQPAKLQMGKLQSYPSGHAPLFLFRPGTLYQCFSNSTQ